MKVKQLIYTSWKNGSSTKKGFMVYSQSEGISADDVNLITHTMRYVTLSSLPYSPTLEQIETMFPRNAAYFQLPSGNWCMAQSSYLGKDYSGRLGNYIIHAYVSAQQPDFSAINLIGSDVFRRSLTEAELGAESNPPALPEVELVSPDVSGDVLQLKVFFTSDKIEELRYFVSAVIRAVKNGEIVYVYDDNDNLKYWYKALNYCLPEDILYRVTYATYSCAVVDGVTIQSVKPGGVFNYRQLLASGALVYDFKENAINNSVVVGNFVSKIVDEFAVDPQNAKARINALGGYISEAGGDLDLAIELSWFYEGKYDKFSDSVSLKRMFDRVTKGTRLSAGELAEIFSGLIIGNPAFPISQFPDMYKYLLSNGDNKIYFDVVAQYVAICAAKTGAVSSYDALYDESVNNSPFDWRSYLNYIFMTGSKSEYLNKVGVQSFAAYLLAVSEINFGKPVDEKLVVTYARSIAHFNDLSLFKKYLERLSSKGLKESVVEKIIREESAQGGILVGADFDKIFNLLDAIAIESVTVKSLLSLLDNHISNAEFVNKFSKYLSNNSNIYAGIEQAASYNASAKRYVDSMICDNFLTKTLDEDALNDFYNKYFSTSQEMREVFLQGLEKYLNSPMQKNPKAKIHSCLAWFNKLNKWYSSHPVDTSRMGNIEAIVKNTVFSVGFENFSAIYKAETEAIKEFVNGYVARNGVPPCEHFDVINLGTKFASIDANRYKSNAFLNEILIKKSIGNYDQKILYALADNYFDDIFNAFKVLAKAGDEKLALEYTNIVIIRLADICNRGYVYSGESAYNSKLLKGLKDLNGKELVKCLPVLVNASILYQGISPISETLDKYFSDYKRRKLQALYDEILHDNNAVSIDKAFKKYMEDKISKAKRGLFDKKDKVEEPDEKEKKVKDKSKK